MRVFKVDKWLLLGLTMIGFSILPAISLHEMFTTGEIDWFARGEGRRSYPAWLIYSGAWLALLYFWISIYIPAGLALARGYIFIIDEDQLCIAGQWLTRSDIVRHGYSFVGYRITTDQSSHLVWPDLNSVGSAELVNFIEQP